MEERIISKKHLVKLGAITMLVPPVGIFMFIHELKYFEKKAIIYCESDALNEVYIDELKERNKFLAEQLRKYL